MVRKFEFSDIKNVNFLLKEFNYTLDQKSFNNDFLNLLVYEENGIKGILVYQNLIDRLEIDYIIVDKDYRKKGIATSLLKYLENNNKNILNITLEVRKSNTPAINFYKKNGFKKAAVRKKYYENEDGILMIKEYR